MKKVLNIFINRNFLLTVILTLLSFINIFSGSKHNPYLILNTTDFVKKYLHAIESGNRKIVHDFIENQYDSLFLTRLPIEMHVTFQMQFYFMSAGLGYKLTDSIYFQDNTIKTLLINKLTGAGIELNIPFSNGSPQKINNFVEFKVIPNPIGMKDYKNLSDQEIVNRLRKCMSLLIKADEFSGAVMFAKDGKPLFKKGYGYANKSDHIPNKIDTKFNIASIGKVFTGIAVTQLAQQGKLLFDDHLDKYLPSDWLNPDISKKIQIRHLLTHTSGLDDYFNKLYNQKEKLIFRDLDDYKILMKNQALSFEPGAKWSYSNTGMLLLGVVIEKITGESYFQYLKEYLFKPAKMINTDGYEKDCPVPNRSIGYIKEYSHDVINWRDNSISRVAKGCPSGGCYSTAEDLLNFDTALRSCMLLSKEYSDIVLSTKPEINSPFYGYGFFIENINSKRIAKHSGDGTGINCQYYSYLDSGYTVIVLSNYNRPAADIVSNVLYQMLIKK